MASVRKPEESMSQGKFLFGMVVCFVVAIAALSLIVPDSTSGVARTLAGAVSRLVAGETAGRQALVGSVWWGVLPMLMAVPAGLLCDGGAQMLPIVMTSAVGGALLLAVIWVELRQRVGACETGAVVAGLLMFPGMLTVSLDGGGGTWALLCGGYTAIHASEWAQTGQLRFAVRMAFGAALLLLCGMTLIPWLVGPLLLLLVIPLVRGSLRGRWRALLLIGALPTVYSLGVWVLVNWLVMGDALFFVRTLSGLWEGRVFAISDVGQLEWVLFGLFGVGLLAGVLKRQGRLCVLGLLGGGALGLSLLYRGSGLGWMSESPMLLAFVLCGVLMAWLGALYLPKYRALAIALACVPLGLSLWGMGEGVRQRGDAVVVEASVAEDVAAYVREQTKFGRVFVPGYEGLGLLSGSDDDLFVCSLDLHLESLRMEYWGQRLFVLVKRPGGRSEMESVHWQGDGLYEFGAERAVHARDWGDWRLFEVVTAPRRFPEVPPILKEGF